MLFFEITGQTDKHPAYYTRSLAAKLGCNPESNSKEITECLQGKTDRELAENVLMFAKDIDHFPMPFHPIVDDFTRKPFLPLEPIESLEKGQFNDVPMVIGHNRDEGTLFIFVYSQNQSKIDESVELWSLNRGGFAGLFRSVIF
jgi:carboxylesterase type B